MPRNPLQRGPTTSHYHNTLGVDETTPDGGGVMVDNQSDPPAAVTTIVAPGAVIAGDEATLNGGVITAPVTIHTNVAPEFVVENDDSERYFEVDSASPVITLHATPDVANRSLIRIGSLEITLTDEAGGNIALAGGVVYIGIGGEMEVGPAGVVKLIGLPTADPTEAGQLWNDGGALKVSAG